MNPSQIYGILRIIIPAGVSYAVGAHWIDANSVAQIGGLLATIVAAGGWSASANTTLSLSKAVAAVPGLQVHVDDNAPAELQEAAADRTVLDIVPAKSGVPVPPTASMRR